MNRISQKLEAARQAREAARREMEGIYERCEEQRREMSADEESRFGRARAEVAMRDAEISDLTDQLKEQAERAEPLSRGFDSLGQPRASGNTGTPPTLREAMATAFRALSAERTLPRTELRTRALVQGGGVGNLGYTVDNLPVTQGSDFGTRFLCQIFPLQNTTAGSVHWNVVTRASGEAAKQPAEGEQKASVAIVGTHNEKIIPTYAAHTKLSTQSMADQSGLTQAVEAILRAGVLAAADVDVLADVAANATPFVPSGAAPQDSILEAAAQLAAAGGTAIVAVVNPLDFVAMATTKSEGAGGYLGFPVGIPLPRIEVSATVPQGKLIVNSGDATGCSIVARDSLTLQIGMEGSDFTANLRTMLLEQRLTSITRVGAHVLYGDLRKAAA